MIMYGLLNHQDKMLNLFFTKDEIMVVTYSRCLSKVVNIKEKNLFCHINVKFHEQVDGHILYYLLNI
jgi:hypothetical protein